MPPDPGSAAADASCSAVRLARSDPPGALSIQSLLDLSPARALEAQRESAPHWCGRHSARRRPRPFRGCHPSLNLASAAQNTPHYAEETAETLTDVSRR